ncbi:MAG: ammonium transporter [Akkermansiaceae bacterium]|nr:ammonium transporter [Akkermansiaceae bacterium]
MRKLTQKMTKAWLLTLTVSFLAGFGESNAEGFDPASEEYAVTAEMLDADHDDYDEGAVDLIGKAIFKYVELGGETSALSDTQRSAMDGYYDRYEDAPFFGLSNLWILLSAFLVFIMHLGFATLESGLTQKKNTVNILFKNVFIICSGLLLYAVYGFNGMYPGDFNGFFAIGSPITNADYGSTDISYGGTGLCQTGFADFIFQAMFAATAATIVSGAVAERVKIGSFMIFAVLLVGFAYPVTGSWKWGEGWLDAKGFYDFAGSSVVHGFGGFAALAAVILLGARKGKYTKEGIKPILGHSMPLATIGAILLWFGWFGFNGGSVLSADPSSISYVIVTTSLGAAAGGLVAIATSWAVLKKPDLSMALNGILAGLVGITAGADQFTLIGAVIAGGIGGTLVVFSVLFLDKIRIDDPVGAISVHGVVGMWGTIAVGLGFLTKADCEATLGVQILGTLAIGAFAFLFTFIVFGILKATIGIRVSEEEEYEGLDVAEHGVPAYAE